MSRIQPCFEKLKADGKKALVTYLVAGDPGPDSTVPLMHALVEAGADMIELGVPFSDPVAEGPVIQAAHERALKYHISIMDALNMVLEFRTQNTKTPIILMGYINPIEVLGYEYILKHAMSAGIDGLITVDLPPEEGEGFFENLRNVNIDPILFLSPTTSKARAQRVFETATGFIYYVALKGVTGSQALDTQRVAEQLEPIRAQTSTPIGVGFGIKDEQSAQEIAAIADAVIVGSALVDKIAQFGTNPEHLLTEVKTFVSSLKRAIDNSVTA